MKEIRILLLGDQGVGKTSIISTIKVSSWVNNPPKKIPPVCIPPDMFVQYKDISTLLLDSGEDVTDEEISKASVILLCYDVTDQESKHRLDQFWLPKICEINDEIPVILVGNKVDLRPSHFENDLEEVITPLIMRFKQVEMGIECSAKAYLKLIDVIFCAQRAVLFPIAPLQDPITKELKPDFEKALLRIFRICDKDFNGYLDDWEVADLQNNVFNGDLLPCHIDGLKEFLLQECDNEKYTREDAAKGLNFEAFKCLQTIFIKKMKLQTCWLILEHFGYNEKLRISEDHISVFDKSQNIKEEEISEEWQGIELSEITIEFLTKLFEQYSSGSNFLDSDAIDEIFLTTIHGCPWEIEEVVECQHGCIDLKAWIGLWQKAFSDDFLKAYELIVYLGFCESFYDAVEIKKDKISALLSESNKTSLNCYVLGLNCRDRSYVTNLDINNKEKYLILTEYDSNRAHEVLLQNKRRMNYCDVICLLYNGSDQSSKFILDLIEQLPKDIAKVLIKTKDLESGPGSVPTEELANELKTSQYTEIPSSDILSSKPALEMILLTAIYPSKGVDHSIVEAVQEEADRDKQKYVLLSLAGAVLASGAVFFGAAPTWKFLKGYFAQSS